MKNILKVMLLITAAAVPLMAAAQGKIAVLDVQTAILQTEVAKKEFKDLQARPDYAESVKQLEVLQKEFMTNKEKLQKDSAVMSDEQKQAEGRKLQSSATDIKYVREKLQAAEQELAKKLMQAFYPKLQQIMPEVIKEESLGLLLDKKTALHVDNGFDVTAKVTAKLNLQ
ncbi:OmpH family outer membrane protein [Dasania marina]|uniref:OmpH family outer membrane protein n=1 Tax=Dasania marina TaxID=471499 RepID=UPI0030DB45B6|tara:strand:- start:60034 stop:60543 length:510 start_codon:yes stop_codon:yes gene_type:complete